MEIDFTRLRYFVAVAEELHFKRAADRLMITPPPLSKQIKLLEKELGGQLFERNYHEVRLTPLGEKLLGPARDILARVEDLKATASRITQGVAPVRVAPRRTHRRISWRGWRRRSRAWRRRRSSASPGRPPRSPPSWCRDTSTSG